MTDKLNDEQRARIAAARDQMRNPRRALRQQAVVGGQRLDDGRGNLVSVPLQQRLQGRLVVERSDQRAVPGIDMRLLIDVLRAVKAAA